MNTIQSWDNCQKLFSHTHTQTLTRTHPSLTHTLIPHSHTHTHPSLTLTLSLSLPHSPCRAYSRVTHAGGHRMRPTNVTLQHHVDTPTSPSHPPRARALTGRPTLATMRPQPEMDFARVSTNPGVASLLHLITRPTGLQPQNCWSLSVHRLEKLSYHLSPSLPSLSSLPSLVVCPRVLS